MKITVLFCIVATSTDLVNCMNCSSNCLTCLTNEYYCQSCMNGYYLAQDWCWSCPSQCQTCTSSSCLTCKSPCQTCDMAKCTSCSGTNYYLLTQTNNCVQCNVDCLVCDQIVCSSCVAPCLTCNNINGCTECQRSYYLSNSLMHPRCIACSANCVDCNSYGCNKCQAGYYIDSTNYTCLACTGTQNNCAKCYGSICSQCNTGYYVSSTNYQCYQLPSPQGILANCTRGSNTSQECYLCNDGYYMSVDKCVACPNNCLNCTSYGCYTCSTGYGVDSNTSPYSCLACDPSCAICYSGWCSSCKPPLKLYNQYCCNPSCLSCNAAGCISCPTQSMFINSSKLCQQCHQSCQTCDATGCLTCPSNNMFVDQFHQCQTCHPLCQTCNANGCLTCNSPRVLADSFCCDSSCLTCNLSGCLTCNPLQVVISSICCDHSCLTCDYTGCLTCPPKTYKNSSNRCVSCNASCATCDINGCTACNAPQIIKAQLCCDPSCASCNSSGCLTCSLDQYLNNNICVVCNSGCKSCTSGQYVNGCTSCGSQCQTCNSLSCKSCLTTSYNTTTAVCYACNETCFHCQQSGSSPICTSCIATNMYVNSAQTLCVSCNPTCLTCTQTACLTCITNYQLYGTSCIYCDSTCKTCSPTKCIECFGPNYYISITKCILCHSTCQTCNSLGCLTCPNTNMYLSIQKICENCDEGCLTCNSTQCLTCMYPNQIVSGKSCQYVCQSPCIQCDSVQCLKCAPDNTNYLLNGQCNSCTSNNCATCKYTTTPICLTCDLNTNRVLISGKCICTGLYYENNTLNCAQFDCNSTAGMTIAQCKYKNCYDQFWTYGEQCDDGNLIPRDGCTNCTIDVDYVCKNVIMQRSVCYECPIHCLNCSYSDSQAACSECKQGYYLSLNQCKQCSSLCSQCELSALNCTKCRFQTSSNECSYCEFDPGYYSNFNTNSCNTICGDAVVSGNEQCDDGNDTSLDGCSNICQVENGYYCTGLNCYRIQYPTPQITLLANPGVYVNVRSFQISYQKYIEYFDINPYKLISVKLAQLSRDNYSIILSHVVANQSNQLIQPLININITFYASCINDTLLVFFDNLSLVRNEELFNQQIDKLSIAVPTFIQVSQLQVAATDASMSFTEYLLYVILGFAGLSLIIGGIDVFYNLLYMLQTLAYLQYINTPLPYNLYSYLKMFKSFQLKYIIQLLHLYTFAPKGKINNSEANTPLKIQQDGITGNLATNFSQFISVVGSVFGTYIAAHLFQLFVDKMVVNLDRGDSSIKIKLKKVFMEIKIEINQFSMTIIKTITNSILRSIQTVSLDLSFYLCLSLYVISYDRVLIDLISVGLNLTYLGIIFYVFILTTLNRSRSKQITSLFEFTHFSTYGIYKNCILLTKKYFFMFSLIICYDSPMIQILNLTLASIIYSLYLFFQNQIPDVHERNKQLICEVLLAMTLQMMMIFVVDDGYDLISVDIRDYVGWACVGTLSAILLAQFFFDTMQQLPKIKLMVKKLCKSKQQQNRGKQTTFI